MLFRQGDLLKLKEPYDPSMPKYCYVIPAMTLEGYVCDCWIVDVNKHPELSDRPVPVRAGEIGTRGYRRYTGPKQDYDPTYELG